MVESIIYFIPAEEKRGGSFSIQDLPYVAELVTAKTSNDHRKQIKNNII